MQQHLTSNLLDAARRAWAFVRLLRPLNVVMILLGVVLGAVLSGGLAALQGSIGVQVWQAAVSAALIGAAANSLNDVLDLDIDRVNRPGRPLPSGWVSATVAKGVWGLGTVGGVALGAMLSLTHLALALGAAGLMVVYNAYLKKTILLGNLVVALVIGLVLIYGGIAAGPIGAALVGAGFAFLTTLAREMVKDIDDMAGDLSVGARTVPLVYGASGAGRGVVGVLLFTLLLTPMPFLVLAYRGLFLLLLLVVDALLLRTVWVMMRPRPEQHARQAGHLLKVVMVAGMVALALGALVQMGD